jgi:drug/metabolite transporter (DMT)-like permease
VLICHTTMKIQKLIHADVALLLVTLIWGSTFTIVKKCLVQVSPLLFISLRFWIATVITLVLMPRALRGISLTTLYRGSILSIALLGGFIFQTLGLRGTSPSRSAFITSLAVLLVPVLGFFIFGHRPKLRTLLGVALAAVGLGLLTLDKLELRFSYGDTLTLICAVIFAIQILLVGRYLPSSDYRQLVILQLAGCATISSLLVAVLETPFLAWDFMLGIYLFIAGVLATALGFYIQNRAQQFTTPNRTALIFSLEPFFAVLFSYLLLGQALTAKEWLGGILVLAGILTSEIKRAPDQLSGSLPAA